ncbi:MAG: type II toxin-antitoxin system VapC family toxin [Microcystis aeruginosa LG13-11]|nr:type II toxin-antitoxin system VapC family toxin [Microcystis aeruginosa LG13-11]
MAYLFDTDAISEMLRKRPLLDYLQWLRSLDRENQYTSSITIAELYKGAFRSPKRNHFLEKIETRIIPEFTILPFDRLTAKIDGEIQAQLEQQGNILAHADLQIASTAIQSNLELVTGNIQHFARVEALRINYTLVHARASSENVQS